MLDPRGIIMQKSESKDDTDALMARNSQNTVNLFNNNYNFEAEMKILETS